MKYSRVYLDAIGYELAPVVVTTTELEQRLGPLYDKLRLQPGQLEALTGIVDIANRIELGQCKAGLVVSCETAREINEIIIDRLAQNPTMDVFKDSLATLTGGSGAVAVLVTDGSFDRARRRKLLGGAT